MAQELSGEALARIERKLDALLERMNLILPAPVKSERVADKLLRLCRMPEPRELPRMKPHRDD